jgi:hypothetical protein
VAIGYVLLAEGSNGVWSGKIPLKSLGILAHIFYHPGVLGLSPLGVDPVMTLLALGRTYVGCPREICLRPGVGDRNNQESQNHKKQKSFFHTNLRSQSFFFIFFEELETPFDLVKYPKARMNKLG